MQTPTPLCWQWPGSPDVPAPEPGQQKTGLKAPGGEQLSAQPSGVSEESVAQASGVLFWAGVQVTDWARGRDIT